MPRRKRIASRRKPNVFFGFRARSAEAALTFALPVWQTAARGDGFPDKTRPAGTPPRDLRATGNLPGSRGAGHAAPFLLEAEAGEEGFVFGGAVERDREEIVAAARPMRGAARRPAVALVVGDIQGVA